MPQVLVIRVDEPLLPIIGCQSVLAAARGRLQTAGYFGMKTHAPPAQGHGWHRRLFHRPRRATRGSRAAIDPVVQSPLQAIDELFRVAEIKPRVQGAHAVRFAVAVGVFEEKNVRRVRHQDAAVPRHGARRQPQPRGEERALLIEAIAVHIFQ